jgi:alpha-D-ribose 1-methylphosphonate 5-triphosphate synthase subunit PhnH
LDADARAAQDWLTFHCGAVIVDQAGEAEFGLALALPDFALFSAGTHEAPESSATLVLQIEALGDGKSYRLMGPGLREPALLRATGLPADFLAVWQRNHALFPRGIDIVLCSGTTLAALPRSVTIEEA